MSNVIRVNFGGGPNTNCEHCKQPVDGEFNLPNGYWHWACWKVAHPTPRYTDPQIDTAYMHGDEDFAQGWYAIIRTDMGADCYCGPHETETRAVDAAKKKAKK